MKITTITEIELSEKEIKEAIRKHMIDKFGAAEMANLQTDHIDVYADGEMDIHCTVKISEVKPTT